MDELVSLFYLYSVGKSPAVFNRKKLSGESHYIKEYPIPAGGNDEASGKREG